MTKRRIALECASACVALMGGAAFAGTTGGGDPVNTVWNAQNARAKLAMPNVEKVSADFGGKPGRDDRRRKYLLKKLTSEGL